MSLSVLETNHFGLIATCLSHLEQRHFLSLRLASDGPRWNVTVIDVAADRSDVLGDRGETLRRVTGSHPVAPEACGSGGAVNDSKSHRGLPSFGSLKVPICAGTTNGQNENKGEAHMVTLAIFQCIGAPPARRNLAVISVNEPPAATGQDWVSHQMMLPLRNAGGATRYCMPREPPGGYRWLTAKSLLVTCWLPHSKSYACINHSFNVASQASLCPTCTLTEDWSTEHFCWTVKGNSGDVILLQVLIIQQGNYQTIYPLTAGKSSNGNKVGLD
ncbi:hypothetical protein B0H19DRAFT_1063467 [Mycena capillaripes]|nr:hypothetical protein B0H19DRAFT_1063467 [Mycena capillaripes]